MCLITPWTCSEGSRSYSVWETGAGVEGSCNAGSVTHASSVAGRISCALSGAVGGRTCARRKMLQVRTQRSRDRARRRASPWMSPTRGGGDMSGKASSRPRSAHEGRVRAVHDHPHALPHIVSLVCHSSRTKCALLAEEGGRRRRGASSGRGLLLHRHSQHPSVVLQAPADQSDCGTCGDEQGGHGRAHVIGRRKHTSMSATGRLRTTWPRPTGDGQDVASASTTATPAPCRVIARRRSGSPIIGRRKTREAYWRRSQPRRVLDLGGDEFIASMLWVNTESHPAAGPPLSLCTCEQARQDVEAIASRLACAPRRKYAPT